MSARPDEAETAGPGAGSGKPRSPSPSPAPLVFALLGCAIGAAWVGAQVLAAHYGYAEWLGRPLVANTDARVRLWRVVALLGVSGATALLLRVGRRRPWVAPVMVGLLLVAGVGVFGARGPLYGPMQGVVWAWRLHGLEVAPAPGAPARSAAGQGRAGAWRRAADPALPPGAVRLASGRIFYPPPDRRRATLPPVPPAVAARAQAAVGVYVRAAAIAFLLLAVAVAAARPPRPRRAPTASHGSATWGDGEDLRATLTPDARLGTGSGEALGLLLGRPTDERPRRVPLDRALIGAAHRAGRAITRAQAAWQARRRGEQLPAEPPPPPTLEVLRYQGDGHLITIAPTRTGKGVSAIVPNLLYYPGSVVVTDPKGENYTLTQRRRRRALQHVWALDPFDITEATQHARGVRGAINPLDIIDATSMDAPDDAALLADMLTLPEETASGTGGDNHFEPEGRALLSALILYVAATHKMGDGNRSLLRVRELVTLPPDRFTQLLAQMRQCGEPDAASGRGEPKLGHVGTLIARGAARIQQKADKERSGVISTAQRCTHFLDSERMTGVLARTTVPLEHLREGKLSLYIVLPTERLSTYRAFMRLMIGVCLRCMVHQGAGQALAAPHGSPQAKPRVLFALDEFANLKRLAPVEDAFTIAAGYGVTFWLFLQDLAQLKAQYRQSWGTFLANADVLQTFGTNDLETARLLSELTGDATILVEGENLSASVSHGKQRSRQEGASQSVSEKGRRLLTPDEVRRLPPDESLVFLRSRSPLRVRKLHYARDAVFAGLWDRPAERPAGAPAPRPPIAAARAVPSSWRDHLPPTRGDGPAPDSAAAPLEDREAIAVAASAGASSAAP